MVKVDNHEIEGRPKDYKLKISDDTLAIILALKEVANALRR